MNIIGVDGVGVRDVATEFASRIVKLANASKEDPSAKIMIITKGRGS